MCGEGVCACEFECPYWLEALDTQRTGYWETCLGPLQEQYILSTDEPSLQAPKLYMFGFNPESLQEISGWVGNLIGI